MRRQKPPQRREVPTEPERADYEVGYGKPPKDTQFKKGQSGNKRGRPKGSQNFATLILKELNRRVTIVENGQRRTITKLEAAVKQHVNKAASGDARAMQQLINISRELGETVIPKDLPTEIIIDVFEQNSDKPLYQVTNYRKRPW